jgi:uncharacterized Zn finger protein (UPF0148 family)
VAKFGEVTCDCGSCPTCKKREYMRSYRKTEQGAVASSSAARAYYERNAPEYRAKREEYRQANIEKVLEADRLYNRTKRRRIPPSPEKKKARNALTYAVWSGRITPQPCEKCGASPINYLGWRAVHAHHDDYSKPLEVRWLCVPCHGDEHRKYPKGVAA